MLKESKIEIRVSEKEKALWQNEAKERGLSLSEYIRSRLNDKSIKTIPIDCSEPMQAVRITLPRKGELMAQANSMGFSSFSDYIRALISDRKIITKTDVKMIFQLRMIGININQIAHALNANPQRRLSEADMAILEDLKKLIANQASQTGGRSIR